MPEPRLTFEDFPFGSVRTFGPRTLTKQEIVAFAREFDAQPMHVDEEAARQGFFGTLVASGWHLCAVYMRMLCDAFLLETASMGAPGVEEARWRKPVPAGAQLTLRTTVHDVRVSKSRPEMGLVLFHGELLDETGEAVMTTRHWAMMARRDPSAPPPPSRVPDPTTASSSPPETLPSGSSSLVAPYLEDLPLGEPCELGSFTFTADDIKRFAREYDPQRFHVDDEAARKSHFGALVASGWHTASVAMKLVLSSREKTISAALARGEPVAGMGPSPGFTDLKWLKPVYVGDTLVYRSAVVEKRPMRSRPRWGIAFLETTAHNQHGELVFSFRGSVMWERRPG